MAQDETLSDKLICLVLYSMGVNKSNPIREKKGDTFRDDFDFLHAGYQRCFYS